MLYEGIKRKEEQNKNSLQGSIIKQLLVRNGKELYIFRIWFHTEHNSKVLLRLRFTPLYDSSLRTQIKWI